MANDELTPAVRIIRAILPENPVYRQLLGMCPTLAVTAALQPAVTMAGATAFVLICANIITSLIRKILQPHLRILVFTLTIATFVTIADRFLAAFLPEMSDMLGPFVPLIIVNCLIISRCEAVASKEGVFVSIIDAIGNSLGFLVALVSVAAVRELLGTGKLWAWPIPGMEAWPAWGIMVLPPGAFLALGLLLALVDWIQLKRQEGGHN